MSLAAGGTYTIAAGQTGLTGLPSGSASLRTRVHGNGATIEGGQIGVLFNSQSYVDYHDLICANQTNVGVYCSAGSPSNIRFYSVTAYSNQASYIDTWKLQNQHSDIYVNGCTAGPNTDGLDTADGFEVWGPAQRVTFEDCISHGHQRGGPDANNGHGFEVYAGDAADVCEDITFLNCEAYNCRVGYSCEGGPDSVAHVNCLADGCNSHDQDYYDYQGVNGASMTAQNAVGDVVINGSVTVL